MNAGTRPPAPWYAPATRRVALLRVGLPTLAACVFAMGPLVVPSTMVRGVRGVAAQVLDEALGAISAHDGHPDADADGHDADASAELR